MKLINLMIFFIVLSLTGCVTTKSFNDVHDPKFKSGNSVIQIPKLNTIASADIGESMYEKSRKYTYDTYNVTVDRYINLSNAGAGKFTTSKYNLGILKTDLKKGWKSVCTKSDYHGYLTCLFDTDNDSKFDQYGAKMNDFYHPIKSPISYTLSRTKARYKEDSFKYVALYQGKKGNSIKISFREFKDNMARPAFTQDIDYELNNVGNTIVGFKGLRIEVLKATNMDINYKVIHDYK